MKFAIVSNDGNDVSLHFGRAPYYIVITVEDGKVSQRELRNKVGHSQFGGQEHHEHGQHQHGMEEGAGRRHAEMIDIIKDCQKVVCGGMGTGIYSAFLRMGITPVVTDLKSVDDIVAAVIDGTLKDHPEKLH